MRKLLASDLDGTLIDNGKINDFNRESILKLKSKNNFFGVSTGRPYNGVSFLKEEYGIDIDFYILLNGALILDRNLKVLKHEKIKYEIVEKIFEEYKDCNLFGIDEGFETNILVGDSHYSWENTHFRSIDEMRGKGCSLISIDFSNKNIEDIDRVCLEINQKFHEHVVVYRNSYFVDVVPKGCSKGNGVKLICEMIGMDFKNVYTIGDSFNDITMFEITENSFTFNNAEEGVKMHANYFVDSVSECIDKYILGE